MSPVQVYEGDGIDRRGLLPAPVLLFEVTVNDVFVNGSGTITRSGKLPREAALSELWRYNDQTLSPEELRTYLDRLLDRAERAAKGEPLDRVSWHPKNSGRRVVVEGFWSSVAKEVEGWTA